jgi:hypothetical protein
MNRRMNNIVSDGFVVDAVRNQVTYNRFEGVQQERESLFYLQSSVEIASHLTEAI